VKRGECVPQVIHGARLDSEDDMDDLFFWFIILGVLSVVGSIVWWALVVFGIFKVAKFANRQFEKQMRQAMQLGKQLQSLPPDQRAAADARMSEILFRVGSQWQQLDNIARQRHDVAMGELMGTAASAGIDWRP
jgi:biopolymer transport protein ExbB/TolQ